MDILRVAFKSVYFEVESAILKGIAPFAAPPHNWLISFGENAPHFLRTWNFAGFIGCIAAADVRGYRSLKIPTVNILDHDTEGFFPSVVFDDRAIGKMAAEHLLDRGFRHFGFIGGSGAHDKLRGAGFTEALEGRHQSLAATNIVSNILPKEFDSLRHWLISLPKPVAIFGSDDFIAWTVIETCRLVGLHVPEDISVVGVNNQIARCESSFPAISSISLPWERVGAEAAAMLARMLAEKTHVAPNIILQPLGISVRASSDLDAMTDVDVAAAVHFIRNHYHEPIGVKHILREVPVSRRLLEMNFKAAMGRTLLDEILHVRTNRAKELLLSTTMRIRDVAGAAGFSNERHLHRVFLKREKITPRGYRVFHRHSPVTFRRPWLEESA